MTKTLPKVEGDSSIVDSLTEGSGELMRFYVTASYELNEGADWPSPWGHYWLYSDRGDGHTTARAAVWGDRWRL